MSTKHRITITLGEAEYKALQRIAEGSDRSLAWLGRRAICDFIERLGRSDAHLLSCLKEGKISIRPSA